MRSLTERIKLRRIFAFSHQHWEVGFLLLAFLKDTIHPTTSLSIFSANWLILFLLNLLLFFIAIWTIRRVVRPIGELLGEVLAFLIMVAAPLAMPARRLILLLRVASNSLIISIQKLIPARFPLPAPFTISDLFSPPVVPFRLYPVTCSLLE